MSSCNPVENSGIFKKPGQRFADDGPRYF